MKKAHGLPVPADARLRAIVELQIARVHLARARDALHDPERRRQTWLCADVRRAADSVEVLVNRAARDQR